MFTARAARASATRVVLSAHCHNDLGLAVANSLAAVQAGARQVECTINGIGERAGNASLEEIVMALQVRARCAAPRHRHRHARRWCRPATRCRAIVGVAVPPNKAIVGANAFAHEAGIHQDGMLKHELTYEIMRPESVGAAGHAAGARQALRACAASMRAAAPSDIACGSRSSNALYLQVTALADRTKTVDDEQLAAIIREEAGCTLAVGAGARAARRAEHGAACR